MDPQMLMQQMAAMQGGGGGMGANMPVPDTAETVYISSLALLKMLRHGRSGVPLEVMGLMIGDFVDDYTVRVLDVFAMPQHGTGVSVEAVDVVYQKEMQDMLKQTGRPEMAVGWYHSHPGFGCWLSGTDMRTQQGFEQLDRRCVAVVVDPIQSVKGKVVIDAFRLINPALAMMGQEPRQTTSNLGHIQKPSIQAIVHGLNKHYYNMPISFRKNDLEVKMLMNLHRRTWTAGLRMADWTAARAETSKAIRDMAGLAKAYHNRIDEEEGKTQTEIVVDSVGKLDPKKRLEASVQTVMSDTIVQCMTAMLDTIVF